MSSLPEIISAAAVAVTAIVAVVSMRQGRADSRDRSRPYMTARFVEDVSNSRAYFVVENFGATAAYNVHIEFDESLSNKDPQPDDFGAYIRKMYAFPGITFGPGESRRSLYMHMNQSARKEDEVVAPDKLTGIVRYWGPDRRVQHAEWIVVDLTGLRYRYDVTSTSADIEQRLKQIGTAVDKFRIESTGGIGIFRDVRDALEARFFPEPAAHREDGDRGSVERHRKGVDRVQNRGSANEEPSGSE